MKWLIVILMVMLAPAVVFGTVIHVTTSGQFPITTAVDNDTISIDADGLTATGRIITGGSGVDNVVVLGNGYTTYGCGDNAAGFQSMVYVNGNDWYIYDWDLRQPDADCDSVRAIELYQTRTGLHLDSVNVFVRGFNSQCLYTNGGSFNIEYGHWASASDAFMTREYFWAAVIWADDGDAAGRTADPRYRIYGITIDSCPFAGIALRGGGKMIIDSNTITLNAHNDRYSYPSGSDFFGCANAFGITIGRVVVGSQISRNIITVKTGKEGGAGIGVGGADPVSGFGSCRVWGNTITVSQGPDDAYGARIPSQGIKAEEGCDTLIIYDNTITVTADNSGATTYVSATAHGIWLAEQTADNVWRVYHNRVIATGSGQYGSCAPDYTVGWSGSCVYALCIETYDTDVTPIDAQFYDNYWSSNVIPVKTGSINASAESTIPGGMNVFIGDTINLATPSYNDGWGYSGAIGLGGGANTSMGNVFRDCIFPGSYVMDQTHESSPVDALYEKTATITVFGSNNRPAQSIRVRMRDAYGISRIVTTTDKYGQASGVVPIYYNQESVPSAADSTFTPYTISAIWGTDSVAHVVNDWGVQAAATDSITMGRMFGGVYLDPIVTVGSGYASAEGPSLGIPRRKTFGWDDTTWIFTTPTDQTVQPSWYYSIDKGATWTGVVAQIGVTTGEVDMHMAVWGDKEDGAHIVMPYHATGDDRIVYRFIASPMTSSSNVGTLRTLWASSNYRMRAGVYASGHDRYDSCWVVMRAVNEGTNPYPDSLRIYLSRDHFAGGSLYDYGRSTGSLSHDMRVGIFPGVDTKPVLWIHKYFEGFYMCPWQNSTTGFGSYPFTLFETCNTDYSGRAFTIANDGTYSHLLWGRPESTALADAYGPYGDTPVRTILSSTAIDQLKREPIATGYNDSIVVAYATTAPSDISSAFVLKVFNGSSWTTDSIPLTESDVVKGDVQMPFEVDTSMHGFFASWTTTAGVLRGRWVSFQSTTEEAPFEDADGDGIGDDEDNCVNDANPSQEDTDGDLVGDSCDNCINDINPAQTDADSDGIGDSCDADFGKLDDAVTEYTFTGADVATMVDRASFNMSLQDNAIAFVRDAVVGTNSNTRRMVVKWPSISLIPDDKNVYTATCSLFVAQPPGGYLGEWQGYVRVNMREVIEEWSADTTALNGQSPTWVNKDGTSGGESAMWTAPGCGIPYSADPTVLDYVDVDSLPNQWIVFDVPVETVQPWLDADSLNYGLVFSTSETWPAGQGAQRERSFWADSTRIYLTFGDSESPAAPKYVKIRK